MSLLPRRSRLPFFELASPTPLPLSLEKEAAEVCPGLWRARRSLAGREVLVASRPVTGSPWLVISDEPERVKAEFGDSSVLNRFRIPLEGQRRVRILAYHVNDKGSPPRNFALWVKGASVSGLRGWDFGKPGEFRGSRFSGVAAACLAGSLPPLATSGTALLQKSQVPGTGDPSRSFFGGLVEADLAGQGWAEIVCSFSTGDPLLTDGDPIVLSPNCGPEQNDMAGHPRGVWPYSAIVSTLAQGEVLEATGRMSDLVQFTLGQSSLEPYGGDVELFRGDPNPPFGRANRGLYCVDHRLEVPFRNPLDFPVSVQALLISLSQDQSRLGMPDSKLFGAMEHEGTILRLERPQDAHGPDQAALLFSRSLAPGQSWTSRSAFHMGVASSGPVGLFIRGVKRA